MCALRLKVELDISVTEYVKIHYMVRKKCVSLFTFTILFLNLVFLISYYHVLDV